jgi:hypothetical protein
MRLRVLSRLDAQPLVLLVDVVGTLQIAGQSQAHGEVVAGRDGLHVVRAEGTHVPLVDLLGQLEGALEVPGHPPVGGDGAERAQQVLVVLVHELLVLVQDLLVEAGRLGEPAEDEQQPAHPVTHPQGGRIGGAELFAAGVVRQTGQVERGAMIAPPVEVAGQVVDQLLHPRVRGAERLRRHGVRVQVGVRPPAVR